LTTVTHGLMSRVFLMKWYHFSVEYFEDLRNVRHCEFLIMRKQEESGKYKLESKLRTWSELRRERAIQTGKEIEGKEIEGKDVKGEVQEEQVEAVSEESGKSKDSLKLDKALSTTSPVIAASPVEPRRRWGGCPNGCNHDKSFKIHSTLADLVKSDDSIAYSAGTNPAGGKGSTSASASASDRVSDDASSVCASENGSAISTLSSSTLVNVGNGAATYGASIASRRPAAKRFEASAGGEGGAVECLGPQIDITRARDEVVSSPDGTPSFISIDDRLRGHLKSPNEPPAPLGSLGARQMYVGRDFGGTYSGHNSVVASDADSSEDDVTHRRMIRLKVALGNGNGNGTSGLGMADSTLSSPSGTTTPHHHRERDQSRMGRGTRANRLGDHPHSSDGEHEADVENDDNDHDHDDDEYDAEEVRAQALKQEQYETSEDEVDLDENHLERVTTKQFDAAEREDRSLLGSVY
jgi:hypothetical protein